MTSPRNVTRTLLALTALLALGGSARADLTFCNDTPLTISSVVGWPDRDAWKSAGWFVLEPGVCQAVLSGDLGARYYLYYGQAIQSRTWGGEYALCVSGSAFQTTISGDCEGRGYQSKGAGQLDVGEATDVTFTFQCSNCSEDDRAPIRRADGRVTITDLRFDGIFCSVGGLFADRQATFTANLQLRNNGARISSDDDAYNCSLRGPPGSMSGAGNCVFAVGGGSARSTIDCPASHLSGQRVGDSLHLSAGGCEGNVMGCNLSADLDVWMKPK